MYKLILFDLDGTLAESKQPITTEMAALLAQILAATRVAIISGGALPQFLSQAIAELPRGANLAHLYLLPTSGAALYEHDNGAWKKIYEERLTEKEAHTIEAAMRAAGAETGLIDFSKPAYGERIEYRGGQITLSALGQRAPLDEKKAWDPTHAKRSALREYIAERLRNSQSASAARPLSTSRNTASTKRTASGNSASASASGNQTRSMSATSLAQEETTKPSIRRLRKRTRYPVPKIRCDSSNP